MAKITKFGTISGDENGDILMTGFSFELDCSETSTDFPTLVGLIINKLKAALEDNEILLITK